MWKQWVVIIDDEWDTASTDLSPAGSCSEVSLQLSSPSESSQLLWHAWGVAEEDMEEAVLQELSICSLEVKPLHDCCDATLTETIRSVVAITTNYPVAIQLLPFFDDVSDVEDALAQSSSGCGHVPITVHDASDNKGEDRTASIHVLTKGSLVFQALGAVLFSSALLFGLVVCAAEIAWILGPEPEVIA